MKCVHFLGSSDETRLAVGVLALVFWLWLSFPRKVPSFTGVSDEKNRRKNITKLRSSCKLFPSPYPNGWYFVCRAEDVRHLLVFGMLGVVFDLTCTQIHTHAHPHTRTYKVKRGTVLAVTAFGKELVAFRGKDNNRVGVLGAFCPHLGTHLGFGGKVEGDRIVCPYHR
jgi:hypothetical protein